MNVDKGICFYMRPSYHRQRTDLAIAGVFYCRRIAIVGALLLSAHWLVLRFRRNSFHEARSVGNPTVNSWILVEFRNNWPFQHNSGQIRLAVKQAFNTLGINLCSTSKGLGSRLPKMTISAEIDMTDDTKSRILNAAGPIFAGKGFAKATVREICGLADVNVASIKYYFGDKQGLYLQTVLFARQMRAERYPTGAGENATEPETRLYEFVSSLLRRLMALHDAPWQVQLLVRELMKPTEACRTIVRDYFQPAFNRLLLEVDLLAQRPLSDAERLKIGFSIIGQCLHYRFGSEVVSLMVPDEIKQEFTVEQLAAHITQFTMAALRNDRALNSNPEISVSEKQRP